MLYTLICAYVTKSKMVLYSLRKHILKLSKNENIFNSPTLKFIYLIIFKPKLYSNSESRKKA